MVSCGAPRCLWERPTDARGLSRHHASCHFYKKSTALASQKRLERAKEAVSAHLTRNSTSHGSTHPQAGRSTVDHHSDISKSVNPLHVSNLSYLIACIFYHANFRCGAVQDQLPLASHWQCIGQGLRFACFLIPAWLPVRVALTCGAAPQRFHNMSMLRWTSTGEMESTIFMLVRISLGIGHLLSLF
jgi:hypothetical protein